MFEIFAFETNGFLESIEKALMQSEDGETDFLSAVPEIFRYMHTIKSSAAMMSFDNISRVAHQAEDLFSFLRDKKPDHVDVKRLTDIVLDSVDFIKRNMVPGACEDPGKTIGEIQAFLEDLKAPSKKEAAPLASPQPEPVAPDEPGLNALILNVTFRPNCQMLGLRAFEVETKVKRAVRQVVADPNSEASDAEAQVRESGLTLMISAHQTVEEIKALIKASPFVEGVRELMPGAQTEPGKDALSGVPDAQPAAPAQNGQGEPGRFVERRTDRSAAFASVSIAKLDQLIDLTGEVVIADMRMRHLYDRGAMDEAADAFQALSKLILELQQVSLSIRMVSLEDTFHKSNRSVRDMVRRLDKDIRFVMQGGDTEVDKRVADQIFTPLIHIIRNAIDHGIEPSDVRARAGKDPQGTVELSARSEGNDVIFTVSDDGRGFDREKIVRKALSSGLVTESQLSDMTDDEINALVFVPGFSTTETVTEFSGRGVGMDAVYDSMKGLGGKITMKSAPGQGSTIILKIPLTMSILGAMILRVGAERCAVPVNCIRGIFAPEETAIRRVNGQDTVLLHERCYPVVNLCDFYGQAPRTPYSDGTMVLVKHEHEQFALFADEVLDHKSVVVKPVPKIFESIKGVYGCTILGDGKVSLILDVGGLIEEANQTMKG